MASIPGISSDSVASLLGTVYGVSVTPPSQKPLSKGGFDAIVSGSVVSAAFGNQGTAGLFDALAQSKGVDGASLGSLYDALV